jgi:integrase
MPIRREQGRWVFDFDRWIDGRRYRRRKTLPAGYTREQAEAFDRAEGSTLHAIAKGHVRPRYDIGAAVACYLRERAPQLKNRASLENEIEATRDWWNGRPIEQLPEVCAEYAADQHGALAPATIKNRISYLRAACRWAWKRHGMADTDPGARVVAPTVRNERQVHIDRRAMLELARACGQWETRAMIRVAFYSGMRFAEIVRAEVVGGRFVLRDTKNGEPRVIPVHPRIRPLLAYEWPEHETMSYWFRKAREAVGRPELHFHDLRHAAASAMLNAGVPLAVVGGVLGHKSSASTKRYSHLATATLAEAIGRIGRKKA